MSNKKDFYTVIGEAIRDFAVHGFDSQARLDYWLSRIKAAAEAALIPEAVMQRRVGEHLVQLFDRLIRRPAQFLKTHPGVSEFTLRQIEPRLRSELNRRILASAS